MENKTLVIFDVCWTLYNWNSTIDYIRFLIKKWYKRYYYPFFLKKYIWIFYVFINKILRKDFSRIIIWNFFKWLKKEEVKKFDKEFSEIYFKNLINISEIEKYKNEKIILLSASINQPIEILANKFKFDYFCSKLEVKNWIYTWKYIFDLLWKKEIIFEQKFFNILWFDKIIFYTDNMEDISLINYFLKKNKSLELYIVKLKNEDYWNQKLKNKKLKYEFI